MKNLNYLTKASMIAAVYAALTLMLAPLSYGMMQIRPSECMIMLCAFSPAAVPGLTAGCLIANLLGPNGIADVIIGTLATFLGAFFAKKLKNRPLLLPLPNVLFNGILVAILLKYYCSVNFPLWVLMSWISLGEFIACYSLGLPLYFLLKKRKGDLKL